MRLQTPTEVELYRSLLRSFNSHELSHPSTEINTVRNFFFVGISESPELSFSSVMFITLRCFTALRCYGYTEVCFPENLLHAARLLGGKFYSHSSEWYVSRKLPIYPSMAMSVPQ